jgi:hypothetical protein
VDRHRKKKLEKRGGAAGALGLLTAPDRYREHKLKRKQTAAALREGIPAGWVALGMRPKRRGR